MKNSLTSIAFIASYVKKYYKGLILVAFFIVFSTWLQVIAPKIMGDSIDSMVTYVTSTLKHDMTTELYEQFENGEALTEEQINQLVNVEGMDTATVEMIKTSTPEQQAMLYQMLKLSVSVAELDPIADVYATLQAEEELSASQKDIITSSFELTQEQIDAVDNSTKKQQQQLFKDIKLFNNVMKLDYEEQIVDSLNAGNDITVLTLDDMKNADGVVISSLLSTNEEELLDDSTNEYQKQLLDYAKLFDDYTLMDGSVERTLTAEQVQVISSASVPDPVKGMVIAKTPTELMATYISYQELYTPTSDIDTSHNQLIDILILLVASYLFLAISNYIYNVVMARISGKSTNDMRRGLFGKLEHLSIRFFDQSNDGDVLSRFTNDIDNISNAMNQALVQILSQVAMLIGIIWMMFIEDTTSYTFENGFILNNILVWSMIGFAVVALIFAFFIIKKAQYYVSRQQDKLGELNGYIDERISGQKNIITYGLQEQSIREFDVFNKEFLNTSVKGQIYSGVLMPLMNGIGLVNLGAMVFLGAVFVANGEMSVGLLITFIQYSQRFFQPLAQVVSQYNVVELALSGAKRVKEIMDVKPEIMNREGAVEIDGINGEVELNDVSFGYFEDKPVLQNIDIKVKKGEMIALVGPTGSGKTTVMNLMNRFYDIDSGEILFDGRNIQDITLDSLRRNVGIVLQESVLFAGTIRDNIAYGDDLATDEMVIDAAKTANIHDFIMTLDDGYETKIDNSTSMFSTGQKQLMSIARTILTDPDLLILDEATSNVDTVTEAKIQKAMENVLKGRTSFVIAHRLKTIMNADEIIVLKDGHIIEKGNHDKLLDEDGFYAELYKNQFVLV